MLDVLLFRGAEGLDLSDHRPVAAHFEFVPGVYERIESIGARPGG